MNTTKHTIGLALTVVLTGFLMLGLSSCALESDVANEASDETVVAETDSVTTEQVAEATSLTEAGLSATPQCVGQALRPALGPSDPTAFYTVPTAANNSSICFLAQGDVSIAVRALQDAMLNCYGAPVGNVDGNFGPHTRQALVFVQQQIGVSADGVYGFQTRSAMKFPRLGMPSRLFCRMTQF